MYIVIFVDSFLSSRWLRFLVRRLLSNSIPQACFFYRSARPWWYFTSAPTRACSAFFLIEPIWFLNRRLSSSLGVDTFEATLVRDVLTPSCTDRMILLTSSSIPSCILKYSGTFFGFSLSRKQNWSKVVVSLLDLKNMHLDLQNLDTFKKQTDVNFIDLDSELVDLNYKVASLIFCHFWRSIG